VDGGYHDDADQQHDDQIRTDYLLEKGFRVIRFRNEEVNTDIKSVILRIKEELNKDKYDSVAAYLEEYITNTATQFAET